MSIREQINEKVKAEFKPRPFENVGDFADFYGQLEYVGYGEHKITDIKQWIRNNWFDCEHMVKSVDLGRYEYRPPQKQYDWKDCIE